MAKLPTGEQLGVVQPITGTQVANVRDAGIAGEAAAEFGKQTTDLATGITKVHDEIAYTNADAAVWKAKVDLDQKYKYDPDPTTAPQRYAAELQGISDQAASTLMTPANRQQFMDMTNRYVIARGTEQIQNLSDTRLQQQAVANLLKSGDEGVTAFSRTDDQADQAALARSYSAQVDLLVQHQQLDPIKADELKKDWIHRAITGYVTGTDDPKEMVRRWNAVNGITTNPEQAPAPNAPAATPTTPESDPYKAALVKGESGGALVPPKKPGGPAGKYQIDSDTAKAWGINYADLTDPSPDARARVEAGVDRGKAINAKALTSALGRDPTDAELTLAHQQGPGGAAALLKNPDQNVFAALRPFYKSDAQALSAIEGNGGSRTETAGQFASHVMDYYGAPNQPASVVAADAQGAGNQVAGPGAPSQPTVAANPQAGSMGAALPADVYNEMQGKVQTAVNAATAEDERAQKAAEKQIQTTLSATELDYKQKMLAHAQDPSQPGVNILDMSRDPKWMLDPKAGNEAIDRLMGIQRTLDKPAGTDGESAKSTVDLIRRIHLDPSNPDAITNENQITDAYTAADGKMKSTDYKFAIDQYEKLHNDTTHSLSTTVNNFINTHKDMIVSKIKGSDDILGQQELYRMTQDINAKIAEYKKAGKDPSVLFNADPNNKEYVGSPGNMQKYITSMFQKAVANLAYHQFGTSAPAGSSSAVSQTPAPSAPLDFQTKDEAKAYLDKNPGAYDEIVKLGVSKGWWSQ